MITGLDHVLIVCPSIDDAENAYTTLLGREPDWRSHDPGGSATIIYQLESGKPYLFVDQLMVYKQNYGYVAPGQKQPQQSALDIRFNLSGYMRKRGAEKA